jgi:hypothetical protein
MTPTSKDSKKEAAPVDSLREPIDGLNIELNRISAEIQSINEGFQAHMQQVVSEVRASIESEYRIRFDRSLEKLREQIRIQTREELQKEFHEEFEKRVERIGEVQIEIERVSMFIEQVAKEIAGMLDDPSADLSKVMRKKGQQAELKAYMEGLRFTIAQKGKANGTGKSEK